MLTRSEWDDEKYLRIREQLIERGLVARGYGPGGSVKRVLNEQVEGDQPNPTDGIAAPRRGRPTDEERLFALTPDDGSYVGNRRLAEQLGWDDEKYARIRDQLVEKEMIVRGPGYGGTVRRILDDEDTETPVDNGGAVGGGASRRGRRTDEERLLLLVPDDGTSISNRRLADQLGWDEDKYARIRDRLVEKELIARGGGQGGTVKRILTNGPEQRDHNDADHGPSQDTASKKGEQQNAAKSRQEAKNTTPSVGGNSTAMPKVFIGSSREGHRIAEWIQAGLEHDAECTLWTQGVFGLSLGNLESLEKATGQYEFAILVLSPDDMVTKRDTTRMSPRDNVLFELGLFMGALGRGRTFIVYCSDRKPDLPTDLDGISAATFRDRSDGNLQAALGPVCLKIRHAIAGSKELSR